MTSATLALRGKPKTQYVGAHINSARPQLLVKQAGINFAEQSFVIRRR